MNIIFAALWYTLQAVDAYVDGHMAQFDVSDELSMRSARRSTSTR